MTRLLSVSLFALGLLLPLTAHADVELETYQALDLPVNDVVYDTKGQRLCVSVGSNGGTRANTITFVNPLTGEIGSSVPVGTNPTKLSLASGASSLYVATGNAGTIEQIDLPSNTIKTKWSLGQSQFGGLLLAQDIEALPGQEGVVAVALGEGSNHRGIVIYDNGVKRPTQTNVFTPAPVLTAVNSTTLWGYNNYSTDFGLRRFSVNSSGIKEVERRSVFSGFGNDIRYVANRLFDSTGRIASASGVLQGTIPGVSGLPALHNNLIFYCGNGSLSGYDINTLRLVGKLSVPSGTNFIGWGKDGFAWRGTSDGKLVLARSALGTGPRPTPVPVPTPRTIRPSLRAWDVPSNDLVWDARRKRFLVTTPSNAEGGIDNNVLPLDPATERAAASIFVGSDPHRMALGDDGKTLYVGLDGSAGVRRVDLSSGKPGVTWSLGESWIGGRRYVEDMAVVPGNSNRVVISRRNQGYSPKHEGVAAYDNGVELPNATQVHTGSNVIEAGEGGAFWGGNNETSEFGLAKLSVTGSGVTQQNVVREAFRGYGFDMAYADGKLYVTNGQVIDVATAQTIARVTGGLMCSDVLSGRLYVLTSQGSGSTPTTISVYALHSLELLGTVEVPEVIYGASLTRWGSSGLAFRTKTDFWSNESNSIMLIEDPLFAPSASLTLSVSSTSFYETAGAQAATGTISRSENLESEVQVNLRSNISSLVVPAVVTIPAGETSVTFDIGAVDDDQVSGPRDALITAFASDYNGAQKTVQIKDDEAKLRLSVTPTTFAENVGARTVKAVVSRGAALSTPLDVDLYSLKTNVIKVPTKVTIPAGASQVEFYLTVIDNTRLDGTKAVTLKAGALYWQTGVANVSVTDDETKAPASPSAGSGSAPTS